MSNEQRMRPRKRKKVCAFCVDKMTSIDYKDSMQMLFTALDLASITSHIHKWVLFLLWLHPFILSGVISPLISGSILGTY